MGTVHILNRATNEHYAWQAFKVEEVPQDQHSELCVLVYNDKGSYPIIIEPFHIRRCCNFYEHGVWESYRAMKLSEAIRIFDNIDQINAALYKIGGREFMHNEEVWLMEPFDDRRAYVFTGDRANPIKTRDKMSYALRRYVKIYLKK